MDADGEITPQHYAFLVSEAEFDQIFGRIRERQLPYWADPGRTHADEINHHDGAGASISKTQMVICWRSSPVHTAVEAGIRNRRASGGEVALLFRRFTIER
jgi:hypothetical protein